ncbi:MAG TPA: patatin-like phospholipase family protein [Hyphomicrobiaceae bacterium]|nr:patatin-like phospholipase family protein [Hyphomicrobiaceae bacterium]
MRLFKRPKRINLALQGGGAHGAFTWGVLDQFLAADDIEIGWLSGASAGALNAVALAHGLAAGDKALARETLTSLWRGIEKAGVPDFVRLNPFLSGFAKSGSLPNITNLFSPYEFNPMGFDPLRDLINEHIDFERIRRDCPVDLVVSATDVATGRARHFRKSELSVDVVLASACLPMLHHAVEIDGRAYWDGGFSANPDCLTIAAESPVRDTLIVQLNPFNKPGAPKSPREIEDRVNTITFNQPLIRDIEAIVLAQEHRDGWMAKRGSKLAHLRAHRFHLIEAGRHTAGLGSDTKALPDNGLLTYLQGAGRIEAAKWIDRNKRDIGRRSTIDLRARYLSDQPDVPFQTGLPDSDTTGEPLLPVEPAGNAGTNGGRTGRAAKAS